MTTIFRPTSLRIRMALRIGFVLLVLTVLELVSSRLILLGGFEQVEQESVHSNVVRVLNAIRDDEQMLLNLTTDHAAWDDTYAFMKTRDKTYLRSNYAGDTLPKLNIDFLFLLDNHDRLVYALAVDEATNQETAAPTALADLAKQGSLLHGKEITGLISHSGTTAVVAAAPVVTTAGTGPSRGTLVFGRKVDTAYIQRIAAITALKPELIMLTTETKVQHQSTLRQLQVNATVVTPIDDRFVSGYGLLQSVDGQPIFLVRLDFARSILAEGERSLRYFFGAVLAIGIAIGIMSLLLVEHLLCTRISRLTDAVNLIGARGDVSQRVTAEGQDELSRLAQAINGMLTELERCQAKPGDQYTGLPPPAHSDQLPQKSLMNRKSSE